MDTVIYVLATMLTHAVMAHILYTLTVEYAFVSKSYSVGITDDGC